ncbi:5-formyltetrahydrofolate cyclo-ligase [Actinomycetospora cinnamomea]|uniref:5-formyltetrahydrofolate cyclo-ligase n=1 Tax=Actinomycetospora cinnamomea TaxID=663609 RepID=A0A2U1FRY8_9PSEU|nr:5-formyltetrahydrofolate cyclo-ligase [Actinomycetospora cinnamomea]PVZ14971.1 5-formyltetrahydrofolate cyclo-ligase [Actinomycetospora cinnamomea]
MSPPSSKAELRRALLAARRARTGEQRRADAAALAADLPAVLEGLEIGPDEPVCLFVAVGGEPGATPDGALPVLDAARATGRRVLLPVTVGAAPLDWAPYDGPGSLVPGPHGLLEPAGRRLGPDALAGAGLVVVPALAVDHRGVRLGRGGGHYDRSLPLAGPATRLVALVGDDGLRAEPLPAEPHDVPVHAAWRPRTGLTPLPLPPDH